MEFVKMSRGQGHELLNKLESAGLDFNLTQAAIVSKGNALIEQMVEVVRKAVLVGAQGASLAYEQGKDKLPFDRWSVSFDEKEALWYAGYNYRVPVRAPPLGR